MPQQVLKMKSMTLAQMLPIALVLLALPGAQAGLILDLTSGGAPTPCGNCGSTGTTFGWAFTVNSPITIDGLGVWNAGSAGLGAALVPVGLYTGDGVLLQSAGITAGSAVIASSSAEGSWLFEYFDPLVLSPGDYRIGQVFWEDFPLAQIDSSFSAIPEIAFLGGVQGPLDGGLMAPLDSFTLNIFGPTLSMPDSAIPEPASVAFVSLGLAGFLLCRRRQ